MTEWAFKRGREWMKILYLWQCERVGLCATPPTRLPASPPARFSSAPPLHLSSSAPIHSHCASEPLRLYTSRTPTPLRFCVTACPRLYDPLNTYQRVNLRVNM
jgi:hypothetical protein